MTDYKQVFALAQEKGYNHIPFENKLYLPIYILVGCSRNGYGCKGNSKIITRVK